MPAITFQAEFTDKGGAKEPSCRKVSLLTQELTEEEIKSLVIAHGQVVTITVAY